MYFHSYFSLISSLSLYLAKTGRSNNAVLYAELEINIKAQKVAGFEY